MRANIAALPDGTYSAEDFLDNDGIVDAPLKIALDITIKGEEMTLDFTRSAPPCAGPVNIARSTAIASCYVALKHVFRDVPANAGCLEPIRFVIPESSILSRQGARSRSAATPRRSCASSTSCSRRWRRRHPTASTAAPMARSTRCRSPATARTGGAG